MNDETLIWCLSCATHLAQHTQGLCPVCLDQRAKETK